MPGGSLEPMQVDRGGNDGRWQQEARDERVPCAQTAEDVILDDIVDAAEAACMLGVTRQHVVLLLQRGRLPGKRLTGTWITTREAVEDYARHRRPPGRPLNLDNR